MNRLNKTESAVFLYCSFSLFLEDSFSRLLLVIVYSIVDRNSYVFSVWSCFISLLYLDLYVLGDDALIS